METLGELIKSLRGKESLRDASKRIGISHTYLDTIEKGYDKRSGKHVNPTPETLKLIAKAYHYNYEDLMIKAGYLEDNKNNNIDNDAMSKDERDIARRLEQFKHDIENSDGLAFSGEPMSDEAKESLIESMKFIYEQTQRINKKYTPKKYRDK